jgi:hypothetical protein
MGLAVETMEKLRLPAEPIVSISARNPLFYGGFVFAFSWLEPETRPALPGWQFR